MTDTTTRTPRPELAAARRRMGLTQEQAAEEIGVTRATFARWERGEQDVRPCYRRRIAERLQATYDEVQRWIDGAQDRSEAGESAHLGLEYHDSLERSLTEITELWRCDVDPVRRRLLIGAAYEATALATPVMRWLLASGRDAADERSGAGHVGRQEVSEVRDAAELFARWDSRYGGGSMRLAATSYLDSRVAGLLQDGRNDVVGRELFAAAAELIRVVGWSTYDIGLHGLAQRHLVQALRLAQEAGDRACGAAILTTLSAQARYLGYPRQAIDLARAGRRGSHGYSSSLARCYLSEARAHAWLVRHGDSSATRACLHTLEQAEDTLSRAQGRTEPGPGGVVDEGKLATEKSHAYLDLGFHAPTRWAREARGWAQTALDIRDHGYTRGRSLAKLTLSRAHLQQSDLTAACALGEEVLDDIQGLTSTHPAGYIREFQNELAPYAKEAEVQQFNDKARLVLT